MAEPVADYPSHLPAERDYSPSPSITPTPAISSCPSLDHTFSTASSVSALSEPADNRRSSSLSASSRRRGYARPQGATFAESAKSRESVMSLGSIAHLQYYFARTGLLDGKGGQLAKERKKSGQESPILVVSREDTNFGGEFLESPSEELPDIGDHWSGAEPVMLPPTVSTYSHRNHYVPPPPDVTVLRRDLVDALEKAIQALEPVEDASAVTLDGELRASSGSGSEDSNSTDKENQGWHELQGMHILDVTTLAIRAARIFYTAHEYPERLAKIKSERKVRKELFAVLEILKRWAGRNFAGGLRDEERLGILGWVSGVSQMLNEESKLEDMENKERDSWRWMMDGDWTGQDRERELAFLNCLAGVMQSLPPWTSADNTPTLPTPFLDRLRDGRELVRLHNRAVRKSRRQFGEIKTFHDDIVKPYRRAENLRYWVKAAEIRWDIKMELDVFGVVHGDSEEAWKKFDTAIMLWCRGVREELTRDWRGQSLRPSGTPLSEIQNLQGGMV